MQKYFAQLHKIFQSFRFSATSQLEVMAARLAQVAKKVIATDAAPAAIGPYSQAVRSGNTLYCSGCLGVDVKTSKLAETVQEQARIALSNMGAILGAEGADFSNVIKTTVFLDDMSNFAAVNEVYASFFQPPFPARACVAVKTLPLHALVEVDCIASLE